MGCLLVVFGALELPLDLPGIKIHALRGARATRIMIRVALGALLVPLDYLLEASGFPFLNVLGPCWIPSGPLGPTQGPGDLQEASKSIFASTFGLYSSPVGYRCVSESVFFLMFCVGLRLHALRG